MEKNWGDTPSVTLSLFKYRHNDRSKVKAPGGPNLTKFRSDPPCDREK